MTTKPTPPVKPTPAPPTAPAGWQRKSYYRPDPADEE